MSATPTAQPNPIFTTSAPAFTLSELVALVRDRYGLETRATLLTSERDLTARLDAADGESFVLKIANAAEDPGVAEFQNRALRHLEGAAPEVPASRLVPGLDGAHEFLAQRDGNAHFARLLTWLPGRPLYGAPQTGTQMRALGQMLGRLARALETFHHPSEDHDIVWDIRRAAQLVPLTHHIADRDLRDRVEAVFARFVTRIQPAEPGFRHQVVHNDFNPFNILVDETDPDRITGILDFGDLVATPAIYDLAVAASYQVGADGPPLAPVVELVSAYHAVHPVPEGELDHLFDLIQTRHAMSITIGEWRAHRYPENAPYILRNRARAAMAIGRCAELSRGEGIAILRQACGFG
ncbi:phosphotransferase [Aureimonas sp. ME7]|uniref:phosphotransferase n=1 Tax=Aureimonas sp. ME7 TaxID=2744252 RepID=UPI0015F476C1|nr:phosphotransferase [Aureimonas sp. ME7]